MVAPEVGPRAGLRRRPRGGGRRRASRLLAVADAGDARLWEIGRIHLPDKHIEEIEKLRLRSGAGGLTRADEDRLVWLVRETDRVMLMRAEAAALLKQRGHDVQVLLNS